MRIPDAVARSGVENACTVFRLFYRTISEKNNLNKKYRNLSTDSGVYFPQKCAAV